MAGKDLNDLKLDPNSHDEPDPRGTDWYRFSEDIQDLLATGRYTWAEDTLQAIAVTVEQTKRVTDGQRRAVNNIEAGANRPSRGSYRRRYEGFSR